MSTPKTLFPHQSIFETPRKPIGRSKKKLRATLRFQGGLYVARWEGRAPRFFGPSIKQALKNLQAGDGQ